MTDAQHVAAIIAIIAVFCAAYTAWRIIFWACGVIVMLWHIYNGK